MSSDSSGSTHNIGQMLANMLTLGQGASTSIPSTTSPSNTTIITSTTLSSMSATPADQLTYRGTYCVLQLCCQRRGFRMLPLEIVMEIYNTNHGRRGRHQQRVTTNTPESEGPRGDPSKPPDRDIFIGELSAEIRRQILATWLPAKEVVVKPLCGLDPPQAKDPKRKGKRNKTSDMMTVSKKIKDEMITCCYEERTFAIHVHEGLTSGGVEVFDAGRQPLHYQDSYVDDRFTRFGDKDEFGFKKLKKIEITFFPTTEDARFTTINTYFMSRALAGLLERGGGDENRIVSITFKFAKGESAKGASDRRSIMARENRWWNPDNNHPRSTALGYMCDIELVLRPFAILDNVHNVGVELPPGADSHAPTTQFVSALVARMTGETSAGVSSAQFDFHHQAQVYMVGKREQLEAEIYKRKYGDGGKSIPSVSEEDFDEREEPKSPGTTFSSQINRRQVVSLDNSDDDDDRKADLIALHGARKRSIQRLEGAKADRNGLISQQAWREFGSLKSGPGRRLGSGPSTATAARRERPRVQTPSTTDEKFATMMQFRERTGASLDSAREWLASNFWSLTAALDQYSAGQAIPSSNGTSTFDSQWLPASSAVKEFCELTGEGLARGREYLFGAGGSVERAVSCWYDDQEVKQTSDDEAIMAGSTLVMPEGALLHQPRASLSASVGTESNSAPPRYDAQSVGPALINPSNVSRNKQEFTADAVESTKRVNEPSREEDMLDD